MNADTNLNIAEIPYESGKIHFRYARVLSSDHTRWLRHGLFVEYSENGTVISEGTYVDGREQGLWRDYYPNGALAAEGHYEQGRECGAWRHWNEQGVEEQPTAYPNG